MSSQVTQPAAVRHYPEFTLDEFECDRGVRMKVECFGHLRCVKTNEVLKSRWHLREYVDGAWRVVASTTLGPFAQAADAVKHFT